MKTHRQNKSRVWLTPILCIALSASLVSQDPSHSQEEEIRGVLKQFQQAVERGDGTFGVRMSTGDFAPHFGPFCESMANAYSRYKTPFLMDVQHVKILRDGRAKAETYLNPGRDLFVFTLKQVDGEWKFCHFEGILLPVFGIPPVPHQYFYQIPKEKIRWIRTELEMAFKHRVYDKLKTDLGEDEAKAFFNDGDGFRTAMDAWLPFIEGAAQFALFYAIMEENLYGSRCVVAEADLDHAEVRCAPLNGLEVLKRASFFPKLSTEEYQNLYSAIMEDRARACGLKLEILYEDTNCVIRLNRIP